MKTFLKKAVIFAAMCSLMFVFTDCVQTNSTGTSKLSLGSNTIKYRPMDASHSQKMRDIEKQCVYEISDQRIADGKSAIVMVSPYEPDSSGNSKIAGKMTSVAAYGIARTVPKIASGIQHIIGIAALPLGLLGKSMKRKKTMDRNEAVAQIKGCMRRNTQDLYSQHY